MSRNAGNDENGEFYDDQNTSSRQGCKQSGTLDDISPKTKMQWNLSSRQRYQRSGEFDEYGEFDDISPKTKMQANELETRVPMKRRIRRIWRI